jgi:hypothetical protein
VINKPSTFSRATTFFLSCCSIAAFLVAFGLETGRCEAQTPPTYGLVMEYGHPDKVYVQSLIQSGLHELALQYVESRLGNREESNAQLSNADAQWLMLRAEIRAAIVSSEISQQFYSPAPLSATLVEIRNQLMSVPEDPRTPWLEWKALWCRWFVLRNATSLHMAAPTRTTLREWCLSELRDAIDKTDRLIDSVKSIPTKDLPQTKPDGLDASQVTALLADSFLLKCDFISLRATSYPAESDDRIAAGTQMQSTLDEAELRIARDWSDRDKLLIARAKSQIFLNLPKKSIEIIDGLLMAGKLNRRELMLPAAAIAAESYRMLSNISLSEEWLQRAGGWRSNPGLAIEHFTNLLASPEDDEITKDQLEQALATKKEISTLFGRYWESRADAIMLSRQPKGTSNTTKTADLSLELVRTEVRQLLLAKRPLDAIDKMAQAEFALAERNATSDALVLAMQSAAIWGLQKDYLNAANEFHRAAMSYPKESQSAEAALNAVAMLREQLKALSDSTSDPENKEEVAQVLSLRKQYLRDICNMWPSSSQADTAISELELTLIADSKLAEIADLWLSRLEKIEPQSIDPRKIQNYYHRAATWFCLIAALGSSPWLESNLLPADSISALPSKFERLHNLARSHALNVSPEDSLGRIFQRVGWEPVMPVEIPNWGDDAPLLRLVQRWARCEMALQNALLFAAQPSADTSGLIEILKQSASLRNSQDLQLLGSNLISHFRKHIDHYGMASKFLGGERDGLVEELKNRESQSPRDPWWIYKTARLFTTQPDLRDAALERYRRLASGFREGTDPWLDCRARSIDILVLQNKRDEGKQLSDVITSLYSELPESWKQRLTPR